METGKQNQNLRSNTTNQSSGYIPTCQKEANKLADSIANQGVTMDTDIQHLCVGHSICQLIKMQNAQSKLST